MSQVMVSEPAESGRAGGERAARERSGSGRVVAVAPLLVAGLVLGVLGDVLLRAPGPPGLNMFLWVAAVALAALVLHRRAGVGLDRERVTWLAIGVLFAAGLVWRDAPPLKLLAAGLQAMSPAAAITGSFAPGGAPSRLRKLR